MGDFVLPNLGPIDFGAAAYLNASMLPALLVLTEVPAAKKISVIKVVRDLTGLNLKDAKGIVEDAPSVVKESAPKAEAEEMKKKLEDAGGKATLKGL